MYAVMAACPGLVRKVGVSIGEWVQPGQSVVELDLVERSLALAAEEPGTVMEVLVRQGMLVNAGDPVVIVARGATVR